VNGGVDGGVDGATGGGGAAAAGGTCGVPTGPSPLHVAAPSGDHGDTSAGSDGVGGGTGDGSCGPRRSSSVGGCQGESFIAADAIHSVSWRPGVSGTVPRSSADARRLLTP